MSRLTPMDFSPGKGQGESNHPSKVDRYISASESLLRLPPFAADGSACSARGVQQFDATSAAIEAQEGIRLNSPALSRLRSFKELPQPSYTSAATIAVTQLGPLIETPPASVRTIQRPQLHPSYSMTLSSSPSMVVEGDTPNRNIMGSLLSQFLTMTNKSPAAQPSRGSPSQGFRGSAGLVDRSPNGSLAAPITQMHPGMEMGTSSSHSFVPSYFSPPLGWSSGSCLVPAGATSGPSLSALARQSPAAAWQSPSSLAMPKGPATHNKPFSLARQRSGSPPASFQGQPLLSSVPSLTSPRGQPGIAAPGGPLNGIGRQRSGSPPAGWPASPGPQPWSPSSAQAGVGSPTGPFSPVGRQRSWSPSAGLRPAAGPQLAPPVVRLHSPRMQERSVSLPAGQPSAAAPPPQLPPPVVRLQSPRMQERSGSPHAGQPPAAAPQQIAPAVVRLLSPRMEALAVAPGTPQPQFIPVEMTRTDMRQASPRQATPRQASPTRAEPTRICSGSRSVSPTRIQSDSALSTASRWISARYKRSESPQQSTQPSRLQTHSGVSPRQPTRDEQPIRSSSVTMLTREVSRRNSIEGGPQRQASIAQVITMECPRSSPTEARSASPVQRLISPTPPPTPGASLLQGSTSSVPAFVTNAFSTPQLSYVSTPSGASTPGFVTNGLPGGRVWNIDGSSIRSDPGFVSTRPPSAANSTASTPRGFGTLRGSCGQPAVSGGAQLPRLTSGSPWLEADSAGSQTLVQTLASAGAMQSSERRHSYTTNSAAGSSTCSIGNGEYLQQNSWVSGVSIDNTPAGWLKGRGTYAPKANAKVPPVKQLQRLISGVPFADGIRSLQSADGADVRVATNAALGGLGTGGSATSDFSTPRSTFSRQQTPNLPQGISLVAPALAQATASVQLQPAQPPNAGRPIASAQGNVQRRLSPRPVAATTVQRQLSPALLAAPTAPEQAQRFLSPALSASQPLARLEPPPEQTPERPQQTPGTQIAQPNQVSIASAPFSEKDISPTDVVTASAVAALDAYLSSVPSQLGVQLPQGGPQFTPLQAQPRGLMAGSAGPIRGLSPPSSRQPSKLVASKSPPVLPQGLGGNTSLSSSIEPRSSGTSSLGTQGIACVESVPVTISSHPIAGRAALSFIDGLLHKNTESEPSGQG